MAELVDAPDSKSGSPQVSEGPTPSFGMLDSFDFLIGAIVVESLTSRETIRIKEVGDIFRKFV